MAAPGASEGATEGTATSPATGTDRAASSASDDDQSSKEKKEKHASKKKVRGDAPCLAWVKPRLPARAVLLCVHGLGLYSESWEEFGKRLSAIGCPTYAIDVRGFGSWMQAKGHQKVNFKACLKDVQTTLKAVRQANPGLPVFLVGESMGGAIALQATALCPDLVDGLISSVPAGDRFQQKKTDLKVALHLLTGPNRPFDIGSQVIKQATQDPGLQRQWQDDPLDRLRLSAKELIQFQGFMNKNHDLAPLIKDKPVLILQGTDDKLVKPEGTVELFNEVASRDKTLELIPDAEHLLLEEGQLREDTYRILVAWLNKHLPEATLDAGGPERPLIAQARALLVKGQLRQAMDVLENAVGMAPRSAEAHLLLGLAYLRTRHHLKAREHLRAAARLGRGSIHSRKANQILMSLPKPFIAPAMGPRTRKFAPGLRRLSPPGPGLAGGGPGSPLPQAGASASACAEIKPTVLIFNASWCEPCKDMDSVIEQAKARFGDRVNFLTVDVDDPANEQLIEQYSISPVPTVVFLKGNGEVASYAIGYAGIDGMIKGMRQILRG